jgi:hypothetical protein
MRAFLGVVMAVCVLLAPAHAQKKKRMDPAECSWCKNDPALLAGAGLVSHGGFAFGKKGSDTEKVEALLSSLDIVWLESEHYRLGFGIGPLPKPKLEEKKKLIAELTRLKEVLPTVAPENLNLDVWMRAHLYAQRLEDLYKRFGELTGVTGMRFAAGMGKTAGGYMGEGPYLGMKEKYEILVLPNEVAQKDFLIEHAGLQVTRTQRWHYTDRGAIAAIVHIRQAKLREDSALHAHLGAQMAHNLFDGLKSYNYDTPIWIHSGLAHYMEREIDPMNNSFDADEGSTFETTSKTNWKAEVYKLVASNQAPRMAELVSLKNYGELKINAHFVVWSMVDYLATEKPEALAKFVQGLKSNFNEQGLPTGANLPDWHRKQFGECLGMNYNQFDEAWRQFVMSRYRGNPKKEDGPGPIGPGGLPLRPGG